MYIVLQCGFKCNCILDNFCDSVAHPYSANKNKKKCWAAYEARRAKRAEAGTAALLCCQFSKLSMVKYLLQLGISLKNR